MEETKMPEVPEVPEIAKVDEKNEYIEYAKNLEFLTNPARFNSVVYEAIGIMIQKLDKIEETLTLYGKK